MPKPLQVQGGLGYSPLRAGLSFAPTAVAFGVVGLNWQRLPGRWQSVAVPGGFLPAAASFAGTGLGAARGNGRRPLAPRRPYGLRRGALVRLPSPAHADVGDRKAAGRGGRRREFW
ncbi:hypothetical protein CGL27_17495 [Streptomyces sp. 11-1-2]|nr:hypothetical protein CGL27_17495 [Streptomyces sp. 11-1-2]